MIDKIFSTVIGIIWLASAFGMGPSGMDPKEFNVYLNDLDDTVILEVPDSSGWRAHEQGMFPVGYEVSEIVEYLKEEYDICIDYTNPVSIPSIKKRDVEPTELDTTLTGITDVPFYGSSLKFVTTDYVAPPGGYGQAIGYTGGNITLNTIECV